MGRKKIQISRITDERNRQVTFNKRKFGVMKKAYELSVLCDCEIALIIFSSSNKLYQYASTDMDKVLLKYTEYNEPHESLTNKNIIEALNKKEHKNGNCNSPESPDPDPAEYSLTPRTEAKYNKIDEDFQLMMQQRNHLNGRSSMGQSNYTLPVTVPVNSTYGDSTSNLMQPSPQMPHGSVSPRPSSSGTDPGGLLDMSNGYPSSSSPLPLPLSSSPSSLHGGGGGGGKGGKMSPGGRVNLRVVIPGSSQQSSSSLGGIDDAPPSISQAEHSRTSWAQVHAHSLRGTSSSMVGTLNTPVISLQSPSIPGMPTYSTTLPNSFTAQDFSVNSDLGLSSLNSLHQAWNSQGQLTAGLHPSSLVHMSLSTSTPPPQSSSPLSVRIKSEPISPPRGDGSNNNTQQNRPSSTGHLSPAQGHITQDRLTPSSHSSPGEAHSHPNNYDTLPLHKRPRLTEEWAT